MKHLSIIIFIMFILLPGLMSCSTDIPDSIPEMGRPVIPDKDENPDNNDDNDNQPMNNQLKITVGSVTFTATLESDAAAMAFNALLPITTDMSEMNGNEKYFYLSKNLPTASVYPGTIRSGDLMLYGTSCVVLFYETFSTSYSYTRLGRVDNPSGLASALGTGRVRVTIERQTTETNHK